MGMPNEALELMILKDEYDGYIYAITDDGNGSNGTMIGFNHILHL